MVIKENVSASALSSYKGGGVVKKLLLPQSKEDYIRALSEVNYNTNKIIGLGSNTLIDDGGVSTLISTRLYRGVFNEDNYFFCLSGTPVCAIIHTAAQKAYDGLSFLFGVPASVGGAVKMNAGAFGFETGEYVHKVTLLIDGKVREYSAQNLFSYRKCVIPSNAVILGVTLKLAKITNTQLDNVIKEYKKKRSSQPKYPSLGCVFKNTKALSAGRLIESLGLKGVRHGGAKISEEHANFIINTGGGSANDYLALALLIQNTAAEKGYFLEREFRVIKNDE